MITFDEPTPPAFSMISAGPDAALPRSEPVVADAAPPAGDDSRHRSLALLAAIVSSCGDAILSCDEHNLITTWNPAAEQMFGYTAAEAIGQSMYLIVPPASMSEPRQLRSELLTTGAPRVVETQRQRKDGSLVEVEMTVSAILDAGGKFLGYSNILRDIGERKANELRLRELEHQFHTFFEHMPGLTYIYVPQTKQPKHGVLHLGQQFERLTGFTVDAWNNDDAFIATLVHPDDRARLRAVNEETERTGGPLNAEYRIVTKDGRVRWIRDQANLVYDEAGEPLYWLGFMLDISEQKQAEVVIRDALGQLEVTNRELEHVNQAKSEVVSVISHELRTPLTSIQGFSELIATEALSMDEARQFAATINQNAQRLARMIGNVLDLDRLEADKAELHLELDDLNRLVTGVLATFRPGNAAHQLIARLDPELPPLWYDPDLIVRVITNLVANAIKYSPRGGPVTVTTRLGPDGVELSVADQGMGIPPDKREAVFSRFGRIVRPEQQGIDGTGLGLTIARQIVAMHGGEITVTDNTPTGCVFHVGLPLLDPPESV